MKLKAIQGHASGISITTPFEVQEMEPVGDGLGKLVGFMEYGGGEFAASHAADPRTQD